MSRNEYSNLLTVVNSGCKEKGTCYIVLNKRNDIKIK